MNSEDVLGLFRCPIDGSRIIAKWRCEKGHEFREEEGIVNFLMKDVKTHDVLEKVAPFYETVWAPLGLTLTAGTTYSSIMKSAASVMGEKHLDVGTGSGKLFDFAKCKTCVGLDISLKFLRYLKRKRPNVLVVRGDARNLPFSDNAFDSVSSLFVIHMLDDPIQAIKEIARVLKPNGRGVIIVMSDNNFIDRALANWWGLKLRSYDYYLGSLSTYFDVKSAKKMGAWSYFEIAKK
ncbi:MAG: class I SAM-dependent methyltransferase [Thermoprotei archaeon]